MSIDINAMFDMLEKSLQITDDVGATTGVERDSNLCPVCDVGHMLVEKGYFSCENCGYLLDRIGTGNAKNGRTDGVSITIVGENAAQYRNFLMKDSNKDSSVLRRDIIYKKYKHRNFLNNNVMSARIIDDATETYFQATMTKTFRAERANQIMAACLSNSCVIHKNFVPDNDIATFMGLKSKGISIGRVILDRLARENKNISIAVDITAEDICGAIIEWLRIDENPADKRAIIAMVNATYDQNIEPSYTLAARTLGLIKVYGENMIQLTASNGRKISTGYLNEITGMSASTIDKSYNDFMKYKKRLMKAIKNEFAVA